MSDLLVGARFVHFATCMVLFGGAFFQVYSGAEPSWSRARLVASIAGPLALLSGAAWLAAIVAGMTGDWQDVTDPATLKDVLADDAFGRQFAWRMTAIAALSLLAVSRSAAESGFGRAFALAASSLVLIGLAFTGHTTTPKGTNVGLRRIVQAVHLLAAGAWVGGLWPLAALLLQTVRNGSAAAIRMAQRAVWRFSSMASGAVVLILGSGLINSYNLVGTRAGLLSTQYGLVLRVKIGLFLTMIAIAVYNRLRLTPRIADGDRAAIAALGRNVLAEQALALLVLLAAGLLGTLVPAIFHAR